METVCRDACSGHDVARVRIGRREGRKGRERDRKSLTVFSAVNSQYLMVFGDLCVVHLTPSFLPPHLPDAVSLPAGCYPSSGLAGHVAEVHVC